MSRPKIVLALKWSLVTTIITLLVCFVSKWILGSVPVISQIALGNWLYKLPFTVSYWYTVLFAPFYSFLFVHLFVRDEDAYRMDWECKEHLSSTIITALCSTFFLLFLAWLSHPEFTVVNSPIKFICFDIMIIYLLSPFVSFFNYGFPEGFVIPFTILPATVVATVLGGPVGFIIAIATAMVVAVTTVLLVLLFKVLGLFETPIDILRDWLRLGKA